MAGGRKSPRASPTARQRKLALRLTWNVLKVRLARFESSGPRGPTNAPRFCKTVMSSGGITNVGLRVSLEHGHLEDNGHVGHDSTGSRLHDGHLTGLRAGSEAALLLVSVDRVVRELCSSARKSLRGRADCRPRHHRASPSTECTRCFRQLVRPWVRWSELT
jgi:hypothetical protein